MIAVDYCMKRAPARNYLKANYAIHCLFFSHSKKCKFTIL